MGYQDLNICPTDKFVLFYHEFAEECKHFFKLSGAGLAGLGAGFTRLTRFSGLEVWISNRFLCNGKRLLRSVKKKHRGGQAPALQDRGNAAANVGRGPVPRRASIVIKNVRGLWGIGRFSCRSDDRGGQTLALQEKGTPVNRRARACPSPCIDRDKKRPWPLGHRAFFVQVGRSRGTGPRATINEGFSAHRRGRPAHYKKIHIHKNPHPENPKILKILIQTTKRAGDRPPRYGNRRRFSFNPENLENPENPAPGLTFIPLPCYTFQKEVSHHGNHWKNG